MVGIELPVRRPSSCAFNHVLKGYKVFRMMEERLLVEEEPIQPERALLELKTMHTLTSRR